MRDRRRREGPSRALAALAALGLLLPMGAAAQEQGEPLAPPAPVCWSGYKKVESLYGLEGTREAIRKAISRGDRSVLQFLGERLVELIGNDAGLALQVVDWAASAGDPEFIVYLRAVRHTEAVHHPQVVERLLELGATHGDPLHQGYALSALETQHQLTPATMDRLATLAKDDRMETGVAMHAARAIGRVMENDFKRSQQFLPYMERLFDIAENSSDEALRLLAVEMGTYPDPRFDGASVERLANFLVNDPSDSVREMAAMVLSAAGDSEAVLAHFRRGFAATEDLCLRLSILRFTLRAGGPKAFPLLKEFARMEPRLKQDQQDFEELYASGLVDFSRLLEAKPVRHNCEARHEEG